MIQRAEPQQFLELCGYFQAEMQNDEDALKRRLSFCLARGSAFVSQNNASQLDGAVCIDSDLLGHFRVLLIHSEDKDILVELLRKSLEYSGDRIFLEQPDSGSVLHDAATFCGFKECGNLSLSKVGLKDLRLLALIKERS